MRISLGEGSNRKLYTIIGFEKLLGDLDTVPIMRPSHFDPVPVSPEMRAYYASPEYKDAMEEIHSRLIQEGKIRPDADSYDSRFWKVMQRELDAGDRHDLMPPL